MKGYFGWSYQPYVPLNCKERENAPYIAALRPGRDFCEVEWVDPVNPQGPHTAVIEQGAGYCGGSRWRAAACYWLI